MKSNNGFTLIELVIVIIVLGILAATAIPKFINIQKDAKIASLKGFEGSFYSANSIVQAKSEILGITKSDAIQDLGDTDITVQYGNMTLTEDNIEKSMAVSGFSIAEHKNSESDLNGVAVYLGDKLAMSSGDVMKENCYLLIQNSYMKGKGDLAGTFIQMGMYTSLIDTGC